MAIINKIIIIVIIITLAFFYFLPPQSKIMATPGSYLSFEHINVENGLTDNYVTCITQDHYGYLWFGTLAGLNKYDGVKFDNYYFDSTNDSITDSDNILTVYEDSDYRLWIGTSIGLKVFNRINNSIVNYINDPYVRVSLSNNRVNTIFEDSTGLLWIGTAEGLNVFNQDTNTYSIYMHEPDNPLSLSNNRINKIFEDSMGLLWIGTDDGLNVFNRDTNTFSIYMNEPDNPLSLSNNGINEIFEDSTGLLWVGTAEGLNVFNRNTNTFSIYMHEPDNPLSLSNDFITAICEGNNNDLWIGTRIGLNRLIKEKGIFHIYKNDASNNYSITNNRIVSLYKDIQGILWIGTINGINKIDFASQLFSYYSGTLGNSNILSISQDTNNDNIIWMEIWGGIIKFDTENKLVINTWNDIIKDQNFYSSMMQTFCVGLDSSLWIGTGHSGLLNFNPASNQLITYKKELNNSLLSDNITTLYMSHSGTLWIGTTNGLCTFDCTNQIFSQYQDNYEYPDSIKNHRITTIYEDFEGNIYFGTNSGVYMLNNETDSINCIMNSSDYIRETSDVSIRTIYEDLEGNIWIGTGYGLYCYTEDKGITSFCEVNNFLEGTILCVLQDNYGDLWVVNRQQGLGKLSMKDGDFTVIGLNKGLKDDFFSVGSSHKAQNGEIFFGVANGLISFYPDNIILNRQAPIIMINSFTSVGHLLKLNDPIEDTEIITLPHSNNSFEIDFVALNYSNTRHNQYLYKLEGFDKNWTYCSANESFTKYTNIPSGKYTFIVKASNSDGVWNEEGAFLKIIITPPFWQQWWFILSLILAAVLFIYLFIQFRTYTLQKYSQKLEHRFEEKTYQLVHKSEQLENELLKRAEFTRALAHELKTPLTPILSSSEFLMNAVEDDITLGFINNIRQGILNLEKRVNELMDMAKGEVGLIKLHCEYIFILNVIKDSIAYFIPEAKKKKQSLILDIPDIFPEIYADEDRLKQVILNLLNNASKFTRRNGTITLKAKEENENIIVEVIDTGCGIDESELEHIFEPYSKLKLKKESLSGLGLGLYLAKLFIELHDGKIWVISTKGKGSTFAFSLPIQHNDDIK